MDPPPAPTVTISTTGTFIGISSIIVCVERRTSPSHKETSVEVPPISKDMIFLIPASFAIPKAPDTPPAGPERIQLTAIFLADPIEMLPPFDCIILMFFVSKPSSIEVKYSDITGET